MYCFGGNATDPIWRVLASSDEISSWTPLKPQHSNPKPNPLANHIWCIDFLNPPTPRNIPHRLLALLESLIPLKNWCSIHATCSKSCLKHSILSVAFFPSLKQNFSAYYSFNVSLRPDYIFEIHQVWQSVFSRVYSNSCCSCWFEPEIIKIGLSFHKMYSNNILKLETYWMHHVYIYIYIEVILIAWSFPFLPLSLSLTLSLTSCVCISIATSRFPRLHPLTELMYVSPYWWANTGVSIGRRTPHENTASTFVLTLPSYAQNVFLSHLGGSEIGSKWPYSCCFEVFASRIYSKGHVAFLCSFQQMPRI